MDNQTEELMHIQNVMIVIQIITGNICIVDRWYRFR